MMGSNCIKLVGGEGGGGLRGSSKLKSVKVVEIHDAGLQMS